MTKDVQLPLRQKIALNLLFCLGSVVIAAGAVRTYYLYSESSEHNSIDQYR
jgi:hypothetical protein